MKYPGWFACGQRLFGYAKVGLTDNTAPFITPKQSLIELFRNYHAHNSVQNRIYRTKKCSRGKINAIYGVSKVFEK